MITTPLPRVGAYDALLCCNLFVPTLLFCGSIASISGLDRELRKCSE